MHYAIKYIQNLYESLISHIVYRFADADAVVVYFTRSLDLPMQRQLDHPLHHHHRLLHYRR